MSRGPTPSQTVGPYLGIGLPWADGPVADAGGVRISGHVLDGAGEPIPDALVEAWVPEPAAFARSATDDDGAWFVVMPRVPFVSVHLLARGLLRHLTTRIYLEPALDDPVLGRVPPDRRATLLAQRTDDGFRLDLRIQGPGETVFFDV